MKSLCKVASPPEIVTPDHHHYIPYNIYRYFFFDVPVEFFVPEERVTGLHAEVSKFVKERNLGFVEFLKWIFLGLFNLWIGFYNIMFYF